MDWPLMLFDRCQLAVRRWRPRLLTGLVALVVASSCQVFGSENKPVVNPTREATLAISTRPFMTPSNEPTQLDEIAAQTPTPVPQLAAESPTPKCAPSGDLTVKKLSPGNLIFGKGGKVWVWNRNMSEPTLLPVDWQSLSVSPFTGAISWLTTQINFMPPRGATIRISRPTHTGLITQWLQNDRFLMRTAQQDDFLSPRMARDEVYEVDPGTNRVVVYMFDMFGFLARGLLSNQYRSLPLYDPTFSFAFYAWQNQTDLQQEGMLLWSLKDRRVIWKESWPWPVEQSGADWRLDGGQLVVSGPRQDGRKSPELIGVSTDGAITQLSNLYQLLGDTQYSIGEMRWSPDGRYVAFVVNADALDPLGDRELFIVDTFSGKSKNLCIDLIRSTSPLVWSPDSMQVAYTTNEDKQLSIVDVNTTDVWSLQFGGSNQRYELYGWTK